MARCLVRDAAYVGVDGAGVVASQLSDLSKLPEARNVYLCKLVFIAFVASAQHCMCTHSAVLHK